MVRIYFKKDPNQKNREFLDACKKAGADYFEEDSAVWKMPKQVGITRAAISISKEGRFKVGIINKSCDNFECIKDNQFYYKEEAEWFIATLSKLKGLLKGLLK